MGFAVDWAPRAEDSLNQLPLPLLQLATDAVYRLADDPVRLSRPPKQGTELYQRYVEDHTVGDDRHRITILFQYSQDEMAIEIMGVYVDSL
jgi:hypothetical protein